MLNEDRSSATINKLTLDTDEDDITKQNPDDVKVKVRDLESQVVS